MKPIEIHYNTTQDNFSFDEEESLLEVFIKNRVPIDHSCEGMASCGTCRILVTSHVADLPPRNTLEAEMSNDRGFEDHERLACQLCPTSRLSFRLPSDPEEP